jgi:hypothetical protein
MAIILINSKKHKTHLKVGDHVTYNPDKLLMQVTRRGKLLNFYFNGCDASGARLHFLSRENFEIFLEYLAIASIDEINFIQISCKTGRAYKVVRSK